VGEADTDAGAEEEAGAAGADVAEEAEDGVAVEL
jgi:hypothetical protein